ncbi:hypothetical protein L6Q79_10780 [bacterium]|nr:hypothetical protein [bacterium]NUN47168.1 hypothetical protein [bacterium]
MKNLIVLVILLLGPKTTLSLAQSNIKVSADMAGKSKISYQGESVSVTTKTGFTVGGEIMRPMNNNVAIGGGLQFQIPRGGKDADGNFNFVPIYAVGTFFSEYGNGIYGKGMLGYNLHYGDSDYKGDAELGGGLCYGFGGGFGIGRKFLIEGMYMINNGTFNIFGEELDVAYSRFTVSLGIIINKTN